MLSSFGLGADGAGLVFSTYLGGQDQEVGQSIAADIAGNAYVSGFQDCFAASSIGSPGRDSLEVMILSF